MTDEERALIRTRMTELVEELASQLSIYPEAVADVAFLHLQKHPNWGRNPTRTQKTASHAYWGGLCQGCGRHVGRREAVFHHIQRRIAGQHQPENMKPYHPGCHDRHHNVMEGSLSKGAPVPGAGPSS